MVKVLLVEILFIRQVVLQQQVVVVLGQLVEITLTVELGQVEQVQHLLSLVRQ